MESFCRGCLIKYDEPVELLEYTGRNRRLYVYLTGIQVKRNDPLPFQVCKGCYVNMKLACRFKKQCRNSDKKVKQFLTQKDVEDIDFATFLKNNDDELLLRFPNINGNSTPSVQRLKEDDNESTCTSIRNFISDLLPPDEIPDTEARIIREVIEEEADILEDTLDSHWLQDEVSIDADYRLDFSFSPFSTPRAGTNERFYSPYKPVNDSEQIKQIAQNEQEVTELKTYQNNIDETDSDSEQLQDKETFIARKKILLNSTSNQNDNLENVTAVQSILDTNKNETDLERLAEEIINKEDENRNPPEVPITNFYVENEAREINIPLEKVDKIDRNLEKALQNECNKEFSLEAILGSSSDKVSDIVTTPHNEENWAVISIKVEEIDDSDPKAKNLDDVFPSKIEAFTTPVYQGASGGCTPTIANILFGKIDGENNTAKSDIVPILDKLEVNSIGTDVLDDFFDKETGAYIGVKKKPLEEANNLEIRKIEFEKLGKSKYDLSDFSCKICDKRYKDGKALKIHFTRMHNFKIIGPRNPEGLVEMICDYCGASFERRSLLRDHLRKHMKPKKPANTVTCTECSLKFSSEAKLRMHMTTHIGKKALKPRDDKYVCPTCGHASSSQSNLTVHMKRHTQLYSYRCDQCDKGYFRKTDFTTHMRIHTGETPFSCTVCEKKFRRADTLNRHLKIHRDDRKHTCQYCKKTFITPQVLKKHIQISNSCLAVRLHGTLIKEHKRKGKPKKPPKLYILEHINKNHPLDQKDISNPSSPKDLSTQKDISSQVDQSSNKNPSNQANEKDPASQNNALVQEDPLSQKDLSTQKDSSCQNYLQSREDPFGQKDPLGQEDPWSEEDLWIQKDTSSEKEAVKEVNLLNEKNLQLPTIKEEMTDTDKIEIEDLLDLQEDDSEDIYENYEVLEDDLDGVETYIDPMDLG